MIFHVEHTSQGIELAQAVSKLLGYYEFLSISVRFLSSSCRSRHYFQGFYDFSKENKHLLARFFLGFSFLAASTWFTNPIQIRSFSFPQHLHSITAFQSIATSPFSATLSVDQCTKVCCCPCALDVYRYRAHSLFLFTYVQSTHNIFLLPRCSRLSYLNSR